MKSIFLHKRILVYCILFCCLSSCKKLVDVAPPYTSTNQGNVYNENATAAAVMTGIYTNMSVNTPTSGGITSLSFFAGLSADEFFLYSGETDLNIIGYYQNALVAQTQSNNGLSFWNSIYPVIYVTNAVLEGLNGSSGLTPAVKQQLMGEAKFMRAFCYFYLVNLYGDVPLATASNYKTNTFLIRTPQADVWAQLISDLKGAELLLSKDYLDATLLATSTERVRPTTWAASAMLARAYLYIGKYDSAEQEASAVINNTGMFELSSLDSAFLRAGLNNNEAIWQLQPVNIGQNSADAQNFIIPSTGLDRDHPCYLTNYLLDSFEVGDRRRMTWVDSVTAGGVTYYYPFKYKINDINAPVDEFDMVLREGELYLIRAEARAQQGNISGAQDDLNVIRNRAGLVATSTVSQSDLLTAIFHERKVELFTEWGQRWLDLKRTGNINTVMGSPVNVTAAKGGNWSPSAALYPIPQSEIQDNPNLQQNPGY